MNNNQFNKSMQTIKNYVDGNIPTKTSQLQNDSDFATNASVDQKIADVNGANNESLAAYIESTYGNNLVVDADRPSSFINKDGSTISGTFTNYIPMKKGESYISNQSYTQYHFFDSEKNHINTVTFLSNPQIFVPGVDGYLLITTSVINNAIVLEGTDLEALRETEYKLQRAKVQPMSKWYGKKWLCIGDSISTDAAGLASVGYAKLISRELGMTVTNVAVSGKTMSYFYNLIDNYPENYDLITVMLGANNHGYNCAIGQLNDDVYKAGTYDSNNSFFAQAQLLYEKLRVKYPKSVIMFIGLIKRWTPDEVKNNADGFMINAVQKTTEAYSNALREMCNWYSIPFVDVYNTIDPRSLINRQTFFCSETDGTHPNDLGHALFIAPVVRDAIIKHEPYFFNDWTANIIYGNIQVNTNTLALNEGASGSINVKLDKAPTNNQTVNITSNSADVTVSPSSLTFTPDNFDTEQVVTINVAEDNEDYADESATLTLSSIRVSNVTVSISITDNDEQPEQPTLTSISATYTQGSKVVYPDTSLDTLKTDLVVKANYSNSTQQTITDYSLSGNLTVGTSIITVTYQGKTTTFNVTVTAKEQQPSEPEPQAGLIHKWLSPDTAVEDAEYNNYPTLQDQVGQLDLTSSQYWREGTAQNSFTTEEYFVINKLGEDIWDMPDGMSFSIKINKYTRLGRYFSELTLLHTGSLNGVNISTDNWVGYNGDSSRFTLTIASATSSAFGDGVIGLIYNGNVTIKGDPELGMININTTADILITFNGETNVIQIYQDTTKVVEAVAEKPLRIDGIINLAANNSNFQTYESIEIYNKVITPTE